MDRIDRSILAALQDNARISNVDLAAYVGLSPSACLRRVALLEQNGVINGYHADLNAAKMGHDVLVLLHITLHGQSAEMMAEFEAAVANIPQVLACFLIAGGQFLRHCKRQSHEIWLRLTTRISNRQKPCR